MKKSCFKLMLIIAVLFSFNLKSQKHKDSLYNRIQTYLYKDPDKAIEVAKKILKSETNIDEKIKYTLYLSKAYTAKRNTDESYKTLLKAQDLLKKSTNIESKIEVLLIIAIQYQQMELYNKTFETLEEVDAISQNLNPNLDKKKHSWLGKSFAVKGFIYKSQGNLDIALTKFFNSIAEYQKAEQSIPIVSNTSIVYYNIGYCYLNKRNYASAEKYFRKSIEFAEKSKAESLKDYALKGLAEN